LLLYVHGFLVLFVDFFFQAEVGIRDRNVTGVQTCALPISVESLIATPLFNNKFLPPISIPSPALSISVFQTLLLICPATALTSRSEERRVGKEGNLRRKTNECEKYTKWYNKQE